MSKQLEEESLKYKTGFKYFYNKAKAIKFLIICTSFGIAIISVLNGIYNFYQSSCIVFTIFIWGLISMYLNNCVSKNKKKAANLQELFDIYVFGINKNEKIMYPKEENYRIPNLCRKNKEKYYDVDDNIIDNKDILYIQEGNITYDKKMRKMYLMGNIIFIVIYITLMVIISTKMKFDIFNLVVTIIVPSINIFNYIVENIIKLRCELDELKAAEVEIKLLINNLNMKNELNIKNLIREFQDFIYLKRKNWTMIPNYVYKIDNLIRGVTYEIQDKNVISNKINLQNEAIELEKKLGIINYLNKYGRVEIVGSVANDLIVNKDIDIHLLTTDNINTISKKVLKYLKIIKLVSRIKIEDFQSEKSSICITISEYYGWQIEIWLCNNEKFVGFKLKEDLRQNLDEDKRQTIMNLKRYYYDKGVLYGELSTIIYKSVIYGSVRNIEEFKVYIMKKYYLEN